MERGNEIDNSHNRNTNGMEMQNDRNQYDKNPVRKKYSKNGNYSQPLIISVLYKLWLNARFYMKTRKKGQSN